MSAGGAPAAAVTEALVPFVEALVRPDPRAARTVVDDLVADGQSVRSIYMDVLGPALVEVGLRWQQARITVAHEHLATATTKSIMARLAPLVGALPVVHRRIVLACTPGELHGVGLRMVADFLEGDGWEVLETGADTPSSDLVAIVVSERPDVVGLSTALSQRLEETATTIAALKALDRPPLVIVGGAAYAGDEALAMRMGADAFATDAAGASAMLRDRFAAT